MIAAYREVNLRLHDDYVTGIPLCEGSLGKAACCRHPNRHRDDQNAADDRTGTSLCTGLYEYMEPGAIVTIDDVEHPKPHPEPVLKAVAGDSAPIRQTTMMVGDSVVDIQSAEAAGVISVGVAGPLKGEAKLAGERRAPYHSGYARFVCVCRIGVGAA